MIIRLKKGTKDIFQSFVPLIYTIVFLCIIMHKRFFETKTTTNFETFTVNYEK
jgi:hypothetical protein